MDLKIVLSIIATIIGTIAFFPYLKEIFNKKTKPHAYTWLIWSLTQGTGVYGILHGGGSWGALNLLVGTLFVIIVFLVSIKYGTKNITRGDTVVLILALLATAVWWQLKQPVISIIMVSVIDFIGYIPSFRKTYADPSSESTLAWAGFTISNVFALFALSQYNLLTVTYILMLAIANFILMMITILRKRS